MDVQQSSVEPQFGGCIFNILTLGIVHEGVAFPVVYFLLDKRGDSNTDEQIDFIQDFSLFKQPSIAFLTADREFVGKACLDYLLHRPKIPFRIRIRESESLSDGSKSFRASVLFADLQISIKLRFSPGDGGYGDGGFTWQPLV